MLSLIIILIAFIWLLKETDWLRVRLPVGVPKVINTPDQLRDNAVDYALNEIWNTVEFAQGDWHLFDSIIIDSAKTIEAELYHRSVPYHAGAKNPFPNLHKKELATMLEVYHSFLPGDD